MFFTLSIIGGLLFRIRGGGVVKLPSTQLSRTIWCVGTALLVALLFHNYWLSLRIIPELFLGLIISGWGSYFDLGRMPGKDNERFRIITVSIIKLFQFNAPDGSFKYDFIGLTNRGLFVTLFAGIDLWLYTANWLFAVSGLLMGLVYSLSWLAHERLKSTKEPTETAEWIFGTIIWLTILLGVWDGRILSY